MQRRNQIPGFILFYEKCIEGKRCDHVGDRLERVITTFLIPDLPPKVVRVEQSKPAIIWDGGAMFPIQG